MAEDDDHFRQEADEESRYRMDARAVGERADENLPILETMAKGGLYVFQVRALGKLGFNDWSTPMTFICA